LLKGLIATFLVSRIQADFQLRLGVPSDLPLFHANRDQLKQILVNLLSNAIRYTPHDTVTVRAWYENERVWITVEDTEMGIAPADLDKIFERFWQVDRCSVWMILTRQ
jgi:signal transduction histidine kinase